MTKDEMQEAVSITARKRGDAYKALFKFAGKDELGPQAAVVLSDLARVCYANKTTAHANPHQMWVAEGRRQVWLHIQTQLKLTDEQVQMFASKVIE
jgi:hypothetical protein